MNPDYEDDFFWGPVFETPKPSEDFHPEDYSHPYDYDDDYHPWDEMGPTAASLLEQSEREKLEARLEIANLERKIEHLRADLANYRYYLRDAETSCNLYRKAILGHITMAEFAKLPKQVRQTVWERYITRP